MLEEEWVHSILLLHRIHTNKIKTSQTLGRDNLNFQELTQAQVKMYNRTLTVDSELGRRQKEQENETEGREAGKEGRTDGRNEEGRRKKEERRIYRSFKSERN